MGKSSDPTNDPQLIWVVASQDSAAAAKLAKDLGLPDAISRLLVSRGFNTTEAAQAFLHPSLLQLHDPYLMLGMQPAVARLRAALAAAEPILIYGDYDADGTVATVLLKTALDRTATAMGVVADVRYHIPHRIREGYGMLDSRIEAAAAEGVRLVVSVDTGIRAFAAAEEAKRVGLDLIVTDHHLPDGAEGMPEALAVLNPNQPLCPYPYKDLCGAGVAFKLAQALLESTVLDEAERTRLREKTLPSFLKLLAIATIADAVPLTGENRAIVSLGLAELRKPSQAGLRILLELAQIDTTRPISATDIAFRVAPRINAAGRMDIASDVVEMFLAKDAAAARVLAEKLHRLNDDRRATEAEALRSIEAQIDTMADAMPACFVLDDAGSGTAWHRGVIGILASRVVDRTARPAIVLTHEDGFAFGSGRSVSGFHLLNAITTVHEQSAEPLFSRFGGHAHAVGFSMPSGRVAELRERLVKLAAEHRDGTLVVEELECDSEVRLNELTPIFLTALEDLGPFGIGNTEPVFLSRGVRLATALKVIKDRHLRLTVEDVPSGVRFGGMVWSRRTDWAAVAQREAWAPGDRLDLAYRLRRNWHPDFGGWELEVVGIRSALSSAR
ncbi:MAG TPA: single-stranded-DNA-specific exonuclease RecJ [Acidobacteriaceae bacterium]